MRAAGRWLVPSSFDDPVKRHFADLIGRPKVPVGGASVDYDIDDVLAVGVVSL